MGTLRTISGKREYENVTLEEAKAKLLERMNSTPSQPWDFFTSPFHVYESQYVYSMNAMHSDKKCPKGDTVLVIDDAEGREFRRFIFRP